MRDVLRGSVVIALLALAGAAPARALDVQQFHGHLSLGYSRVFIDRHERQDSTFLKPCARPRAMPDRDARQTGPGPPTGPDTATEPRLPIPYRARRPSTPRHGNRAVASDPVGARVGWSHLANGAGRSTPRR